MAARCRGQRTGRSQIGHAAVLAFRFQTLHFLHVIDVREHVQLRRHAECERVLECVAKSVRVGVDQSRQQRRTCPVDDFGVRDRFRQFPHRLDLASLDQDIGGIDDPPAIEDSRVPNYKTLCGHPLAVNHRRHNDEENLP